jgi:hypothetical protein
VGTLVIFAAVGGVMLVALARAAAREETVPVGARPENTDARPAIERVREQDRQSWERMLARAEHSSGWQLWHHVAAGLWIAGTIWLSVRAMAAAFDGSIVALLWALLSVVWLSAAHRAVLLARREPGPPDPLWPIRTRSGT